MRMCDVLQGRHPCETCDVEAVTDNRIKMLRRHHYDSYKNRKNQEANFWVDRPIDLFDSEQWGMQVQEMIY